MFRRKRRRSGRSYGRRRVRSFRRRGSVGRRRSVRGIRIGRRM